MSEITPWWIFESAIIEEKIASYRSKGLKVFASSSFQSHSIPLLHLLSKIQPKIPIAFLNTGFHFPETLKFRDALISKLDLHVI
jgi:phosphoadenosine phosphosulfate reductase